MLCAKNCRLTGSDCRYTVPRHKGSYMQKLAKIIFLLTALNAVFVFGTRVDQGSTSEGTAFQSGTTTQCTSSAQTRGAPCLQYFFNGAQFGLVGTIESDQFGSNTVSG